MTVACEEVFGPVLSVIPFDTEDEAIALANDTRYGLAGAVWTKDIHRGHRVAHALRTGTVWINAYRVVGPDVPFGPSRPVPDDAPPLDRVVALAGRDTSWAPAGSSRRQE